MLKWTVGHRKTAGVKRSPSTSGGGGGGGSGPCYSIKRAAAKLHLSRRHSRTSSGSGLDSRRSKSSDKENRGGKEDVQHGSPRTRDSVYMRLDTIPAALRDLSNQQASPVPSPVPAPAVVKRSRSRARKVRSARFPGESQDETQNSSSQLRPVSAQKLPPKSTVCLQNEEFSLLAPSRLSTRNEDISQKHIHSSTALHQRSSTHSSFQHSSIAVTQSPLQIEYSPCPIRTTKSLLALRRRLTDVFVQPYRSVGTLHPPPQTSHDNPLYFTLQEEKGSSSSKSFTAKKNSRSNTCDITKSPTKQITEEVPIKFRRKDPSLCFPEKKNVACRTDRESFDKCRKIYNTGTCKLENKSGSCETTKVNSNRLSLSPLSRNLASLRLSNGSAEGSILQYSRVTPPSPFLNSTTFISTLISTSQGQRSQLPNNFGMVHDVTDPRFLSLYSMLDTADAPGKSPKHEAKSPRMESRDEKQDSPHTPQFQGPVNRILCYPEESPVKKTDTSQNCELQKRPSLRRTRTLTSNSEEGPPVKVQPVLSSSGHLMLTHKSKTTENVRYTNNSTSETLDSSESKHCRRSSETSRTRKSLRRRSKLVSESSESSSLKGLGDGVFASENVVCDSVFSNEDSSSFTLHPDSFEERSMLRRQGGFRRRQRTIFKSSGTSDSCLMKIQTRTQRTQYSGLTLPNGIPSPFSPQDAKSWWLDNNNSIASVSNVRKTCVVPCQTVGLPATGTVQDSSHHDVYKPSSTIISRLSGTVSCSNIPERSPHFGLTLSKGIPSPPSPPNEDDDQYSSSVGIPGVQPLPSSPVQPIDGVWRGEKAPADENASSSSDDTWNSHNMHFLKSPRLTEAHVLHGVPLETDCHMKEVEPVAAIAASSVNPSPLALVERRSRSRRCLLFASPGGSSRPRRASSVRVNSWKMSKDSSQNRGELELSIYGNSGFLTIHVVSGRNLHRTGGKACNAYVKVTLVPSSEERTFHRTSVHRESSNPWFDQKFTFEVLPTDLDKRVFVSAWHRDKEKRRSEFLGCMSFAVKYAVKKDISGSFRLLSQNAGRTQHVSADPPGGPGAKHTVMARQSDSSVEEVISVDESDVAPTPAMERRKSCAKKKMERAGNEDSSFLRHLELEPTGDSGPGRGVGPTTGPSIANKGGRTPFTTTRRLTRHGNSGFGFSIAWTQPPRVERVEAGLPADRAGLRPGDYVIFVEKYNVVTMPEEEILHLIRSCGNQLTLEVYRRASPNGLVGGSTTTTAAATVPPPAPAPAPPRSSTTCSATTTSLDLSKRRLHLPQVTFSSETEPLNREEARRRAVYQLLNKEQHYALCLQFGLSRFLVPLSERRDLLNANEHYTLFQNAEELLRLTEDTLEQLIHDEAEPYGQSLGRVYLKKMPIMTAGYRRYFSGLKKADCLLASKTRNSEFMRIIVEPPVPRRRPDLTAFIHKPLEHYRDVLKLLQTILNYTKVTDEDYSALLRVVQELQATYRDATMGSGLMEPEGEGRPLLSLQDLESRLVFTRCKPFVLSSPGRQWIFGGDLSRVEGRAVRPFWALLFTDLLMFAKVSRDRVLFITEEPLSLLSVTQAFFNIRKKANEFRLLLDGGGEGTDSPAPGGCGPELPLSRNPKKSTRRRTISLRAPTAELKAVWQNLIQRQIIYLNTTRGGTPASSPLDSPDPPTTLSVATLDSFSLRRQTPMPECKSLGNSQRHLDDLIEHKCRQLGKSGASKGSALHLAQWMKGQLGGATMTGPLTPDDEPEPEVWSPETLRRRSEQLQIIGMGNLIAVRNESRCEELEMSDTERSQSRSTERSRSQTSSDSQCLPQVTVRSGGPEKTVAVCRQCHKTCLANSNVTAQHQASIDNNNELGLDEDEDDYDDNWGPLILMGMTALNATVGLTKSTSDPFSPTEVPRISVLPPTPDTTPRNSNFQWDDSELISCIAGSTPSADTPSQRQDTIMSESFRKKFDDDDDEDDDDDDSADNSLRDQEPPYRSLTSPGGIKRYGTLASLEMLDEKEQEAAEDATDSEWDSDPEDGDCDKSPEQTASPESPQLEVVTQSLRGWTARAGSFVAEKMALFERLGEDSRAAAFFDRYLRPTAESPQQPVRGDSPPDPNTASSGGAEDECSTSAATSGEEVWGTPTSGGELDEELVFPAADVSAVSQDSPADSTSSAGVGDDDTELMMDELLATPPLSSSARGFPPRRRLEPLPEEEDTDSPTSTPAPIIEKETPSPEQGSESGVVADNYRRAPPPPPPVASSTPASIQQQPQQGPGFFNRLRLRRGREEPHRVKSSRLLGFLSGRRSAEDASGGKPLFRLFNREAVDDIPTTLPRQLTPRRQNGKQLERRFWKQLKRRRSGSNAVISSSTQVAA
ncbi:uncharacterized protein PsGEF [Periplaneta americana]|uniref:uncharacterized protein PsGEF n=1 Tax=Periplaneta americana TaxID=6978 RepID=UPI0037E847A3